MEKAKVSRIKKLSIFSKNTIRKESSIINKLNKIFASSTSVQKKSEISFKLENLKIENLDSFKIISHYTVNDCDVNIAQDSV